MDFTKMYCNIHPCELVTNFCNKNQCLIGLCANCICTHTQQHIEKNTSPDYQNIRETYRKIQDHLRQQTQIFEVDKQRLSNIKTKIGEKRIKIRQTIDLAKQQVLAVLGAYFDEKQKKMLNEIESQQKKCGLHNINRLDSLNSFITRQVSNLISSSQQLTTNNFLQSLPRIRTQYLTNSQKLHSEISHEMDLNQKFITSISFNKQLMSELANIMEKAISLKFSGIIYHQLSNKQNGRRPTSMGKTIARSCSSQAIDPLLLSYIKDRNITSQITINHAPHYPQQNPTINFKPLGQIQKPSYLTQIQNSQQNPKPQPQSHSQPEQTHQKISLSQKNFNKNYQLQPHHHPSNSVPYLNFPRSNRSSAISHNVSLEQKILANREYSQVLDERSIDMDHSQNSNTLSNLVALNSNLQIDPSLFQKNMETTGLGISKKSRKSGLRIIGPHELQFRNSKTKKVQIYQPPSDRPLHC